MNDKHRPADFESLEPPLEAAVKAALAEEIPEDVVERVKSRAKQLGDCPNFRDSENGTVPFGDAPASSSRHRRWNASRSLIAGLTAAAALLVMAIGGFLLLDYSSNQAFAQMIEKVKAASSVRFSTATRFGKGREITGVMYLEGNRMRFEQFDSTMIQMADVDRKQGLLLNMPGKLAQTIEIDADIVRSFNNPIDQLRRVKLDEAEQIGQEMLRGRRTQVYRFHKVDMLFFKGDAEMMVWVDVESELPAKIEIHDSDPKSLTEFRFDEFVWNEPLDARLFSLAIPEGFKTGVVAEIPKAPKKFNATLPDNPNYLTDGILCRDGVPWSIVWNPQRTTITALLRDPESTPLMEQQAGSLRRWDVATGKLLWSDTRLVPRHFAQTADGKILATVYNYEVELRDASTGKITKAWATEEMLSEMAFSPDGKTLAAGIAEWGKYGGRGGKEWGGVEFWDIERGVLVRTIKSDDKPVTFVKYSIDGKFLATSAGSIKLWNVATGELARIFPGISHLDFSPDGQTIACQVASSPADKNVGRIDIFNLKDGSLVRSFAGEKGAKKSWVTSVTFSPDGRLLAATDWNGSVTLWDVASGECKRTLIDVKVGVVTAAFSPDGATLAIGSEDKTLRLWKLPAELIRPMEEKK